MGGEVDPPPRRPHQEYARRQKPLIEGLQAKLEAGELAASYLGSDRNPQSLREVVRPTTFSDAEIDYDLDEIVGDSMRLASPEIFDPHDVPLNVQVPDWFAAAFGLASPPSQRTRCFAALDGGRGDVSSVRQLPPRRAAGHGVRTDPDAGQGRRAAPPCLFEG